MISSDWLALAFVAFMIAVSVLICWRTKRRLDEQYLKCPACEAFLKKVMPFVLRAYCPRCGREYEVELKREAAESEREATARRQLGDNSGFRWARPKRRLP